MCRRRDRKTTPAIDILNKYFTADMAMLITAHSEYSLELCSKLINSNDMRAARREFVDSTYIFAGNKYMEFVSQTMEKMSKYPFANEGEVSEFEDKFWALYDSRKQMFIDGTRSFTNNWFGEAQEGDDYEEQIEGFIFVNTEAEIDIGIHILRDKLKTKNESIMHNYLSVALGGVLGLLGAALTLFLGK